MIYEKYIYIFYDFSTLSWHRHLKSLLEENNSPTILNIFYNDCWRLVDAGSQVIRRHGIYVVLLTYPGLQQQGVTSDAWWRHQMETVSALLALFVRGIHRSPVNSPHKGQWRGALIFSLICAWINGWVNNREAGDLRRLRAHYDVTVMALGLFY